AKGVFEVDTSVDLARRALSRGVGLPIDEQIEIAESKLEPVKFEILPVEDYLDESRRTRPERQQLDAGLAARAAKIDIERASYFPSLFVVGGIRYAYAPNRERQTNPFANDEFNYWTPV